MYITESEILKVIENVLRENRKVIKLPNQNNNSMPTDMNMGGMPDMGAAPDMNQDMGGMQDGMDTPMDYEMNNSQDMGGDDENQFDNDFDAGVEADENSDPKRYIQQLTGKLSQTLNKFNDEQGDDEGLNKYVASMIIAASCKNLNEKAKKELIEKIKSANSEDDDIDMDDTEDIDSDEDFNDADMDGDENMDDEMQQNQPMNESIYTKKRLNEMLMNMNDEDDNENRPIQQRKINNCPKAWRSKFK